MCQQKFINSFIKLKTAIIRSHELQTRGSEILSFYQTFRYPDQAQPLAEKGIF